jgi:NAD-dependent deacetylase
MKDKKIIFFTGAGISAESGISTFRDTGGLWEEYKIEDICTAGCLESNRDETIEFYNKRRLDIQNKNPNYAHTSIATLQKKYPDNIQIITQNVDDLFEKANCNDVLHLHGYLRELRCENKKCNNILDIAYEEQNQTLKCPICQGLLRPNIVFFGEEAPKYQDMHAILQDVDIMIIIGTSGNVINVDYLISNAKYTILNNLELSYAINDKVFDKVIYDKATIAIDEIKLIVENFLNN